MLKVIIADDEQRVGRLVHHLIHWEELQLEFVGQCCDGQKAWELIEKIQPDIVITDIRMPVMTGLELLQRTSEKYPQIHFVIISGYRYFEYAQKALKYGVADYILKPIDEEELNCTLKKICQLHTKLESNRLQVEQIERKYCSNVRQLEQELLHRLINEEKPEKLEQLKEQYDSEVPRGLYQVVLLQVDRFVHQEGSVEQKNLIMMWAQKAAQDFFGAYRVMVCLEKDMQLFVLLHYPCDKKTEAYESINLWIDECRRYVNNFSGNTVTIGVSQAKSEFLCVTDLLREAKHATARKLIEGSGVLMKLSDEERNAEINPIWMKKARKNLQSGIELLRVDSMNKAITDNFAQAYSENATSWQFMELAHNTLQWFETYLQEHSMTPSQEWSHTAWMNCRSSQSLHALTENLMQALDDELERLLAERTKSEDYPVRIAMEYVQLNCSDVTLEEAARRSGFNATYFSEMFKRKTGKCFWDYVTEIRMNTAKEMLRNSRKKIYEVAEEVGYNDVKYFSQQFTKNVGMKPSEYRKLYY